MRATRNYDPIERDYANTKAFPSPCGAHGRAGVPAGPCSCLW